MEADSLACLTTENPFSTPLRKDTLGQTIKELFSGIDLKWFEACRQVALSGNSIQCDLYFKIVNKHLRVNIIKSKRGQIITLFNDITEIVKSDEAFKKHSILFENAKDILLYLKSDGSIIDANKTAVEKYGYSRAELMEMKLQQLRHPSTMKDYEEQMETSASKGVIFECIHVRKDGTSFPVEVSSKAIDINCELIRIHIIRDITERKQAEEQIRYLANYDALTGIPNRGFLKQQFDKILEQAKRGKFKFAVMLFEIDKFKLVNDIHGHNAGDEVLIQVSKRLQEAVREADIIGRLGGDEFLVIQPFIKGKEDCATLARRILDHAARPVKWNDTNLEVHISIGIAIYPDDAEDTQTLIHRADNAMYSIKQNGGNSYGFSNGG